MQRAIAVVENVPTIMAHAPKWAALPSPGLGIHRVLVKNSPQSSFGNIGAASFRIKRQIAASTAIELQPHRRIKISIGFSSRSVIEVRRRRGEGSGSAMMKSQDPEYADSPGTQSPGTQRNIII